MAFMGVRRWPLMGRNPSQMQPDEFLRRHGLRLVAAAAHHLEVLVGGDDEVRLGGDGAVGEFVVVGISGDEVEAERRRDSMDILPHRFHGIHRVEDEGDVRRVGHAGGCLLVFEQDLRAHRPAQPACGPCVKDRPVGMPPLEHGQHHVRIGLGGPLPE